MKNYLKSFLLMALGLTACFQGLCFAADEEDLLVVYSYEEDEARIRKKVSEVFYEILGAETVDFREGQLFLHLDGLGFISSEECYLNIVIKKEGGFSEISATVVRLVDGLWVRVDEASVFKGSQIILEGVAKELNRPYVGYLSTLDEVYSIGVVPLGMKEEFAVMSLRRFYK